MKKFSIFICFISLFSIFCILLSLANREDVNSAKISKESTVNENVNDIENMVSVSSTEVKLSHDAKIIINKYYKDCKHTTSSGFNIPRDMVNMSKEDIEKEYPEWEILEFDKNKVSLYKEFSGICDEHYVVSIENNKIVVYTIDEEGKKSLYEITDISTEYLPTEDIEELKKGIEVAEQVNLNALLENYE